MKQNQVFVQPVGLRLLRMLRNISQDELARACGIDRAQISRAERGFHVSKNVRARIAAALETSEKAIFGSNPETDQGADQ